MSELKHTLSYNILPPEERYKTSAKFAGHILVDSAYALNLNKSSLICLDATQTQVWSSKCCHNLYPHTCIIKDVHGNYFSNGFTFKLSSVQINELVENNYIVKI